VLNGEQTSVMEPPAHSESRDFTAPAILNVDDDTAGRYSMTRILRQAGYRVEEAATGRETLRLAASKPFSLVILDVNLPDVSGFEVCRRLKSAPETSRVPILHVSATYVTSQAQVQGLEGGADGYLVEPVEPEVLVATVRSLLRMRRAEEALRKSEEKFRRLADSNIIGITSWESGQLLEANGAFLRMLGYSPADPASAALSYSAITAPESAAQDAKAKLERMDRGACSPYEKTYVRKDGSHVPALVGAVALNDPSENTWVEFAVDLTERKRLEEQFREAQKFDSLGILAAGIAHDFNNLLTGVMGSSSLLLDKAPPGSQDAMLLGTILEASQRAADLTRQILAYSGKGRHFVRRFPVSDAIREIRELIQSSLPSLVRLEMDLPDGLPPIEADATQIQQIMINLVTNAGEAIAPDTGEVRIRAGARDNYVYIEVEDTGRGMDAATRAKIFDPFFSTKFIGRGLGLSAVAGIVRAHKGSIHVETAPGQGTIVRVHLPISGAG
jgi:PAS domain S-box-containing protein